MTLVFVLERESETCDIIWKPNILLFKQKRKSNNKINTKTHSHNAILIYFHPTDWNHTYCYVNEFIYYFCNAQRCSTQMFALVQIHTNSGYWIKWIFLESSVFRTCSWTKKKKKKITIHLSSRIHKSRLTCCLFFLSSQSNSEWIETMMILPNCDRHTY